MTQPKIGAKRGRPKGAKNKLTNQFDKAYEHYAKQYGMDPVEFLFRVMTGADKSEDWGSGRIQAAIALLKRKVPELRSLDANVNQNETKQLVIVWDDDSENNNTLSTAPVSEGITLEAETL